MDYLKQKKNMKTVLKVILMAIAYLATFLLGASSGAITPTCYAYVGALLPLVFAFIYLYTCSNIRCFGAATALNGVILVLFLIVGEADLGYIIATVVITVLAELLRKIFGYDTKKGVRWSFVPFAFSFFAYTSHWWTDTEGSLAAAVEEMPAGYDQLMIKVINNIPVLIVVLVLTIPVAIFSMRLAERILKKPAATFK